LGGTLKRSIRVVFGSQKFLLFFFGVRAAAEQSRVFSFVVRKELVVYVIYIHFVSG
jgi:hypothetical protein